MEQCWQQVWIRKGNQVSDVSGLDKLLKADGFASGPGKIQKAEWIGYVARVKERIRLSDKTRALEVGCGGGAFLSEVSNRERIIGVDYSESLLRVCKKAFSRATVVGADAAALPFRDNAFEVVFANSVFQYFPNLEYAERVIKEISRVTRWHGRIAILDINDKQKKGEYEKRRTQISGNTYAARYSSLQHLFFEKEWFRLFADKAGLTCQIENQNIPGYENSPFRFNVFFVKTTTNDFPNQ